ncbi:MAG: XRE family transcriptional regulator [Pseudomonadota bacterium]
MAAALRNAVEEGAARGVGPDLRALRKSRGVTLTELALSTGRSVGWLSQVERGLSTPTFEDLRRLADRLSAPVSLFFSDSDIPEEERGHIVRWGAGRKLGAPESGLSEMLLSPDLGGEFEIVRSVFDPGAELPAFQQRPTEEAGFVISGRLDLWIGERLFELSEGDSFRFRREPYRWRNPGDAPCVVIWVIAPPVY